MASHPRNAQVLPSFVLGDHSQKRGMSGNKKESPVKKTPPKSQSNGKPISLTHLNHPTITSNVTPFGGIGAQSSENSARRKKSKEIMTPTESDKDLETSSPSPQLIPEGSLKKSIEFDQAHNTSSDSPVPPEDSFETHLTEMTLPRDFSPSPANVPPLDTQLLPLKDLDEQLLPSDSHPMESQTLANVENQNEKVGESNLSDSLEQEKSLQAKKESALEKLHLALEESIPTASTESHPPQSRGHQSHTPKLSEAITSKVPLQKISIITDLDASHPVPQQRFAHTLYRFPHILW